MFASKMRLPRIRTLCTFAATSVAAIPLLLAACENGVQQEPALAESAWHAFGDSGEQIRFLTRSSHGRDGAARLRIAVRSAEMSSLVLRQLSLRPFLNASGQSGLALDWQDERGSLLWSYELELGFPDGFALVERCGAQWLRIELSERDGEIEERYRSAAGTVVARQSTLHAESCPAPKSGNGCRFADEHPALQRAGEQFADIYASLPALQFNEDGEQLTRLLADSAIRAELRQQLRFESEDRSREMATACRWAERGLLKCRFFPAQNPICHAAIGVSLACWIAELAGE